ncbi:147c6516-3f38-48fd-9720-f57f50a1b963 [Sclerotinia trifoliorum]|uniref:147c6516-3f38-48fd-9720-f57f50a1b963 n=1 Tax=Sclerotinia trifoliorum TaxID=28548 RepID=A0A8H2VR69_9HELO|nr:147c6516-3f38-48fd-9720-f57f50a1b963 [Sclerotinia trifoliorum]
MSFLSFLQVMGTTLVVAACVYLISNPLPLEETPVVIQVAPQPITQSLPESQAAQLAASSSTKKMTRVEQLAGSGMVASASPEIRRRPVIRPAITLSLVERRLRDRLPSRQPIEEVIRFSSSVAGAQQKNTISSDIIMTDVEMTEDASVYAEMSEVISTEVEMTDAPVFQLKSCFRSSSSRSAKRVSFAGPSGDSIRGQVITYVVPRKMKNYHQKYLGQKRCPHETFPLVEERDQEGNATGWFTKRDGVFLHPIAHGVFERCDENASCTKCRESLSEGFLDPEVDFSDAILEAEEYALGFYVLRDQYRRYGCINHGGH